MERDRLDRIEMDLARVSRQIAGLPVRIARSGGGGSQNLSATMMVLTEDLAAATGDTSSIIPALAEAQLYVTDAGTGERTKDGTNTTTVYNYDVCNSYATRTQVWVATGGSFPEVISAACCQMHEPA